MFSRPHYKRHFDMNRYCFGWILRFKTLGAYGRKYFVFTKNSKNVLEINQRQYMSKIQHICFPSYTPRRLEVLLWNF